MKVLLFAQKSIYAHRIIKEFENIKGLDVVGLIFSQTLLSGKGDWESFRIIWKKGGWGILWGKAVDMIFSQPDKHNFHYPVFYSKDVNSPETLAQIRALKPDLIVSIFFNQIIKKNLLNLPGRGVINIHPAYLPQYRGVGPTFWALANNERESGVTYHYIDEGIDSGNILKRIKVPIERSDSVHSLYLRCSQAAADILPEVVTMIRSGKIAGIVQNKNEATYFGLPDREGYRRLCLNKRKFISVHDMIGRLRRK